jgi:hypothetical protein
MFNYYLFFQLGLKMEEVYALGLYLYTERSGQLDS